MLLKQLPYITAQVFEHSYGYGMTFPLPGPVEKSGTKANEYHAEESVDKPGLR